LVLPVERDQLVWGTGAGSAWGIWPLREGAPASMHVQRRRLRLPQKKRRVCL